MKKYYLGGKSPFLRKQIFHFVMVPHAGTLFSAIMWWIRRENKNCHSFCPTCKYYYRCQEDVALNKLYHDHGGYLK